MEHSHDASTPAAGIAAPSRACGANGGGTSKLNISCASRRRIALFFLALALTETVNYLSNTPLFPVENLTNILYPMILLAWLITVKHRLLQPQVRRYYILGALLLIATFIARYLRYNITPSHSAFYRWLWYIYYLPFTAVPLCSFSAAFFSGREETAAAPRWLDGLWLACGCLTVLILTNDLHGLMFRLSAPGSADYTYGPVYYAVVVWIAAVTLTGFGILMHRCRLSQCRALWYIPVLAAVPGVALLAWYYANGGSSPRLLGYNLYNVQEAYMLLFLFVWESCVQIGLILSNTDYEMIFALSPLNALITDGKGKLRLAAAGMASPSPEMLSAALDAPQKLDGDHILKSHLIRGGAAYWVEDISAVNRANRAIEDAIEYLEDEQIQLAEEASIKTERQTYETQNRIYDSIAPLVQPQLARAQRLLTGEIADEAEFRRRLTESLVLCVYAKRRVNLALLASGEAALSTLELELSIRETMEYLDLSGVACSLERIGREAALPSDELLLAYDFFAALLEAALPDLSAIFAVLQTEPCLALKVGLAAPTALPAREWRGGQLAALGADVSYTEEDGLSFARLSFGEEARP